MNIVVLIGRITAKPELRYTTSNIAVTSFNIAVDNGYGEEKKTDFIKVQAWRKQAENACEYLDKGSLIAIDGSIRTRSYQDKDGNNRVDTFVVANQLKFLQSKKSEVKVEAKKENELIDEDPFSEFGEKVSIDDNFLE